MAVASRAVAAVAGPALLTRSYSDAPSQTSAPIAIRRPMRRVSESQDLIQPLPVKPRQVPAVLLRPSPTPHKSPPAVALSQTPGRTSAVAATPPVVSETPPAQQTVLSFMKQLSKGPVPRRSPVEIAGFEESCRTQPWSRVGVERMTDGTMRPVRVEVYRNRSNEMWVHFMTLRLLPAQ